MYGSKIIHNDANQQQAPPSTYWHLAKCDLTKELISLRPDDESQIRLEKTSTNLNKPHLIYASPAADCIRTKMLQWSMGVVA